MAMNRYMHPRNIYKFPPDFKQLALEYPEFRQFVKQDISGKVSLDFKELKALRVLSRTLLKKDFGLEVEIPVNKLIPTIPLRLNYILWLEDLLSLTGKEDNIKGIDIGTGASCVYPLLAAKKNNWSMLASEVDHQSFQCALENVAQNSLQELIEIVKVEENVILRGLVNHEDYDFCMCNPPFFSSTAELNPFYNARKISRPKPKNSFCASANEVIVPGGEIEFVSKMIRESKELGIKIKIYTTMLGHKSSLPPLKKLLREVNVNTFCEAEFCQGNTTRWGLAWTYCSEFDLKKCLDPVKLLAKANKPKEPVIYKFPLSDFSEYSLVSVSEVLLKMFEQLQMTIEEVSRKKSSLRYFVTAYSNTWSNQRRKRRAKLRQSVDSISNNNSDNMDPPFLDEESDAKSPGKRMFDSCCEGTSIKKLRISDNVATPFYRFSCGIVSHESQVFLELDCIDDYYNKDYLYQILQYIKNNTKTDQQF